MEAKRLFYGDASSVGGARLFVRDALAATDAPEDVVDCAVLLISELATNVTLHARTEVQVAVRLVEGASLRAEVRDWYSRLPQPCLSPEGATTRRGLHLVDAIASSWGSSVTPAGRWSGSSWTFLALASPNGTVNSGAPRRDGVPEAEHCARQASGGGERPPTLTGAEVDPSAHLTIT